jgi:hypothetical protein
MNRFIQSFLFLWLSSWSALSYSAPVVQDSLRFEVLLNSDMLRTQNIQEPLIHSFDLTARHLILLSTKQSFYLLGWGGIEPIGKEMEGEISSFTYTPDGFLMIVHNTDLCTIDSLGNLVNLLELPGQDMGITAGDSVMYLFDRSSSKSKSLLYVLAKGGKYCQLLSSPGPITAVMEKQKQLLFSTKNMLFAFNFTTKELTTLAVLEQDKTTRSIAMNPSGTIIYLSTDNAIYVLQNAQLSMISDQYGGDLRYFNNSLLVFNPEKQYLVRIIGLDASITH